jgi:O-antigen ligase
MNVIILVVVSFFVMECMSAILIGGGGLSTFYGSDAAAQLYSQLLPLIVFITTYYVCSNLMMIKRAISVFMLTAPMVIGLGYLEKISNMIIFTPKIGLVDSEGIHVASTFWDPNSLGRYLIILIMLALPFFVYDNKINIWNILLSIAALILLLFTGSGSSLVCLLIAFVIFTVFSKYFRSSVEGTYKAIRFSFFQIIKYFTFCLAAVFFVASICFLFKDYIFITFNKLLTFQISARFNLDLAGLAMFRSSPLYGIGFSHYPKLFNKFNPMLHVFGLGQEAGSHNSLIKVASEMGIIGLIQLLYIYYYFIKITLMYGRAIKSDYLRRIQLSLGTIWIAMIVNSWGYWRFFEDPRIWFVAGLALAINNLREGI